MSTKNSLKKYHSPSRRAMRIISQRVLLKPATRRVLKITISGRENLVKIDSRKPLIIVANHSSHFDAPLILTSLPREIGTQVATAAAADYFFAKWWSGKTTRIFFNTFPVDRDGSGAHRGMTENLLREKVPVLIFPEGTRSRTGEMGEWHTGAARLAIEHGAQILPISLKGAGAAWPAGEKHWHSGGGRPVVEVVFREIIRPREHETAEELTLRIKQAVARGLARV